MPKTDEFSGFEVLAGGDFLRNRVEIPPFKARFPWYGGDLQTMCDRLPMAAPTVVLEPDQMLQLALDDYSGEGLVAALNRPPDDNSKPLLLLVHGLGGTHDSSYMVAAAKYFLSRGHACLRINLRGSGESAWTSTGIYSAGVSHDLKGIIDNLDENLLSKGIWIMGFSLGANVVLKYMGERQVSAAVKGAIAVSPPIDLLTSQLRLNQFRNRPYRRYLMTKLRNSFDSANWGRRPPPVPSSGAIKSIIEFDEKVIAPWHGFDGALDYYEKCSSGQFVENIEKPSLIIHAKTDPWIPAAVYFDQRWSDHDKFCVLLTDDGGHVGFHDSASEIQWHLRAAAEYLDASG